MDGHIVLTDFGFAKIIEPGMRTYTLCGTPEYIAPEVLLNKGHAKPVDWWTLGILTYEMIVGQPPFCDEDPMGIYQKILAGKVYFPKYFDKDAKSLVKHLLTADLSKRYGNLKDGSNDILRSKWMADVEWPRLEKHDGHRSLGSDRCLPRVDERVGVGFLRLETSRGVDRKSAPSQGSSLRPALSSSIVALPSC